MRAPIDQTAVANVLDPFGESRTLRARPTNRTSCCLGAGADLQPPLDLPWADTGSAHPGRQSARDRSRGNPLARDAKAPCERLPTSVATGVILWFR